jgi:hypothetical protein
LKITNFLKDHSQQITALLHFHIHVTSNSLEKQIDMQDVYRQKVMIAPHLVQVS